MICRPRHAVRTTLAERPAWLGRERNNAAKSTRGPEGRPLNVSRVQKGLGSIPKMICRPRHAVRTTLASNRLGWVEKEITLQNRREAREGRPLNVSPVQKGLGSIPKMICPPRHAVRTTLASNRLGWVEKEITLAKIESRGPEGRPLNVRPSPERAGINPEDDLPGHGMPCERRCEQPAWLGRERNNAAKSTRGPEGRPINVSPVQKGLGSIPKMICRPRHAVRTTLASNRLGLGTRKK